jgi:hypothetical protein
VTNQQRGIIAAVFVVALLGGGLLAFLLLNRGGGQGVSLATTSPEAVVTDSPAASESPSASTAPSEAASTAPPSPSATAAPTATPTAAPTRTPNPTSTPPPKPTTVVVTELKLDAKTDSEGHSRRISWTTAGTGPVTVAMRVTSNAGAAQICLARTGSSLECRTSADTTYSSNANRANHDFAISLIGSGDDTPIVEVTITFPASTPQILIERPRFGGTDTPEYNGIQVIVQPRRGGNVTLDASWDTPFKYEVDLFEQGGDNRSQQFPNQPAATEVQRAFPITGTNPWKLVLQNIEPGTGRTQLNATVAWP